MIEKISEKSLTVMFICFLVIILAQGILLYKMNNYNVQASEILNTTYYELYDLSINRNASKSDMYILYQGRVKDLGKIK